MAARQQRATRSSDALAMPFTSQVQLFLPVQAIHAFHIHPLAEALQHHRQPSVAKAPPLLRKLT